MADGLLLLSVPFALPRGSGLPTQLDMIGLLRALAISVAASATPAVAQDYFATTVPAVNDWDREGRARGAPPNNDCNMSSPDYATNGAGTTWLVATDFDAITIPPGQAVDSVTVSVLARYDMNETGTLRLQAQWNGNTVGDDFTVNSASGNCRWRSVSITAAETDFWSSQELNAITLRVRRLNTNNNNDLRVKAFRISVTYGDDCNGNGVVDALDLAMGAPDCNGNGVIDSCDFASGVLTDCNQNGVPDQCSGDCNGNGQQDDLELCAGAADCNGNGRLDSCDIALGASDCNGDGVLDACTLAGLFMQSDTFDVDFGFASTLDVTANDIGFDPTLMRAVPSGSAFGYGSFTTGPTPGTLRFISNGQPNRCGQLTLRYVIQNQPGCPSFQSSSRFIVLNIAPDPDDCDGNCRDDRIDLQAGLTTDCDGDGIPTACETTLEDCNGNGISDCVDVATGASSDTNGNGVPDECEGAPPSTYCTPMTNSAGCVSVMGFTGNPSSQSSTFRVFSNNLIHPTFAIMIWSRGSISVPLLGGTLCVGPQIIRGAVLSSSPTSAPPPCNGRVAFWWSSGFLASRGLGPGDQVFCQFWSRDPQGATGANLTDAVQFTVLP